MKGIFSPILALLPCFIYALLHVLGIDALYAIAAALSISLVGDIVSRYILKSWIYSMVFMIVTLSLIVTLATWLIFHDKVDDRGFYFVVFEVISIILLGLSRLNKAIVRTFYFRKKDLLQKTLLKNFYDSGTLISYIFISHLFVVLIFKFLEASSAINHIPTWNFVLLTLAPICIITLILFFKLYTNIKLANKLKKEEWIPIITEKGEVTGKIAKSITLKMRDKFRHPIVRTALICGDKMYLQERKANDVLCPGKLDHPFEKYALFSHGIEEAVRNNILHILGKRKIQMDLQYVLRYSYENEGTKRLIFLYSAKIENEDVINKTNKMTGKFWTIKQIEDGFADEVFAENFELEFEYLKNMVLSDNHTGMINS